MSTLIVHPVRMYMHVRMYVYKPSIGHLQSQFSVCTCCTGVLCGLCESGYGVSALLNKCVSCSDGLIGLLPLLGELAQIVR